MWTVEEGKESLKKIGAKVTIQRVAILKQLAGRTDHPSAEILYGELKHAYPSLSIATVYNTAQLFSDANLIKIISIDDKRVYFDPEINDHGHFLCRSCGKLLDIPFDNDIVTTALRVHKSIESIEQTDIFLYGFCRSCAIHTY